MPLENCDKAHYEYTAKVMEGHLRAHGPLYTVWFPGGVYASWSHACVIVGVRDNGRLIYHDPGVGPRQEMHMQNWSKLRLRSTNAILRKADVVPFSRVNSL